MEIKIMFYPEKTEEELSRGEKQSLMMFTHHKKTRTELIKLAREKMRKMGWEEVRELTGISQYKITEQK